MINTTKMSKTKYNIGDTLVPKEDIPGFDEITIHHIDDSFYYCRIINGLVSIPIKTLENNYQIK
jgi:hypothetical protein